jgi:hypothetical protein
MKRNNYLSGEIQGSRDFTKSQEEDNVWSHLQILFVLRKVELKLVVQDFTDVLGLSVNSCTRTISAVVDCASRRI